MVSLNNSDELNLTFRSPYKHFEYLSMLSGMINTPTFFLSMMANILKELPARKVVVLMDDILINSKNFTEHCLLISKVMPWLMENCLAADIKTSIFEGKEETLQGNMISEERISMEAVKVEAITK